MNEILNKLNADRTLQENISKYIDVFVDFYGEDKRDEIERKFNNATFVGYLSPEMQQVELTKLIKEKSKELESKVLEYNETSLDGIDLFDTYDYSLKIFQPINNYQNFIELYKLGKEGRKEKYIEDTYNDIKKYLNELTKEEYLKIIETKVLPEKYQNIPYWLKNNIQYTTNLQNIEENYEKSFNKASSLIRKIIPRCTLDNFDINNEEIEKLDKVIEKYKETLKEYENFEKENIEYFNEMQVNEDLEMSLREKYYKEFLKENIDLIKEEDRQGVIEYLNDSKKSYLMNYSVRSLLGSSIQSESILESFCEEQEDILNNEETSTFIKNNIIENRIKYFNDIGINLGNNYNLYLENEDVKNNWPTKERLEKFRATKNKLINNFMKEYYLNTVSHKRLRQVVDSKNLLNKDDGLDQTMYNSSLGKTCVATNLKEIDGKLEAAPLVMISFGGFDGALDHDIIHELNHLYELSLESVINNKVVYLCGWDICEDDIVGEVNDYIDITKEEPKRSYELFNEIINEVIAQEIEEKMHEKGIHILDSSRNSKVKGNTSYEASFFIIKDFYKEFRDEIIKSRSNGNIKEILDVVGEKNFNDLNDLFDIYFENLSGLKKMQLFDDIKNNRTTNLTIKYYEIVDKSKEIMERMREESKKKKGENITI
ncbi:MAG: hypothetical protein SPJ74_04365 [Bacilli bacterium]|nr:hypothetical protein [Bacilli bacterium]